MIERRGWLLDLYPDPEIDGLTLWLLDETGPRVRLSQPFPVIFYASGPFARLRQLWQFLRTQPVPVTLARVQRQDLFTGPLEVLAIETPGPGTQTRLFHTLTRAFPDLDYYDADIPASLRYAAAFDVFPLAYCRAVCTPENQIVQLEPLDSPWQMEAASPPLRMMTITPHPDPHHSPPECLQIQVGGSRLTLPIHPPKRLLIQLGALLKRHDPDLLLTDGGDTWLFPYLLDACEQENLEPFNPNRDARCAVLRRKENSYFTYGQVVYRGPQAHLFGRWHIDRKNAMLFGEYGLEGVFEQARVTGLPVQEIARKSPGAGITAMQMLTASRQGILVPYQKQQAEAPKTARALIRADRGGLVYPPRMGLHTDVAELDFVSMYPSIMAHFNLSPETVGVHSNQAEMIPELGLPVDVSRPGLVPETLRPLLEKRIALKMLLATLHRRDCRYAPLQARAAALKWLLVVCFGYLGYKNARFGRIESHEAVTAYGRESLIRAKEAAEDLDFRVLHLYVDGLWVVKPGVNTVPACQPVMDEILKRTGLPLALEGLYKWVAFLPSRMDARVPVANRYFGVFQNGDIKTRGIEARRRDTPPWITEIQMEMLTQLARAEEVSQIPRAFPALIATLHQRLQQLSTGRVPLEKLLVSQTLSRELDAYKTPSPAARAARQLEQHGKPTRPGQRVRFLYTRTTPGVYAWDAPGAPDPRALDTPRYRELFHRAAHTVLSPFGVEADRLHDWLFSKASYRAPVGVLPTRPRALPLDF